MDLDPEAEGARRVPEELWRRLRADPARAPEHVALAAAELHGPAAAAWVEQRRAMYAYGPADLAKMARKRHVHFARLGGAAMGVGGFATMIGDLAALAWIQSRMVFYVAAAFGYDPRDPMRPAELLVLQRLFEDPFEARRALDGAGGTVAGAFVGRRLARDEELATRLLRMVGNHAAKRLAGKAIPGLAIAVNAVGNARDTRALGDRAIAFYGG